MAYNYYRPIETRRALTVSYQRYSILVKIRIGRDTHREMGVSRGNISNNIYTNRRGYENVID